MDKSYKTVLNGVMAIYDISPEISSKLAVWPGDQTFQQEVSLDFASGDHLMLSSFKSTVHLGAHADAPNHYHPEGEGISERSLEYYYGACQVIHVDIDFGQRIQVEHIVHEKILAKRVLFATQSFPDPCHWNENFCSLSPDLIHSLAVAGVITIGIDTPSIDPFSSRELEAHKAIFKNNMAVLEGVVLDKVPAGVYQLVALPLKIKGSDASPVRAILVSDQ